MVFAKDGVDGRKHSAPQHHQTQEKLEAHPQKLHEEEGVHARVDDEAFIRAGGHKRPELAQAGDSSRVPARFAMNFIRVSTNNVGKALTG